MKKLPAKVVQRAKALASARPPPPPKPVPARPVTEKKAKLVAALKRLHPMD